MASAAQIEGLPATKGRDLWKLGDAAVLLVYSCVVLWTVQYHEKWADEAQAWLIARDLDLKTIWFHELRYEGSPGLWHTILWIAQHVFHAGYGALGYIGVAFAIAGAAVLIFCAPFPRYIRWPLAFTYVMVYQYAVIARPYTLLPLLAFCAAIFLKDTARPERITLALFIMIMLTLHGAILAACLGLAYLSEAAGSWRSLEDSIRRRYFICITILVLAFLFVAVILKPTPDVGEFAAKEQFNPPPGVVPYIPGIPEKAEAVFSGAFLDYIVPSILFVLLGAWWCYCRKCLLEFLGPILLLAGLYIFVHGYPHHHGTLFIAAVTAFWIGWPAGEEKRHPTVRDLWMERLIVALLLVLCAVNIADAAVVVRREYLYPYSGGKDAADYLKAVGADRTPMFGFLYGITAVQAYFDHNIVSNVHTAYFHHGIPREGIELDLQQLHAVNPEYIIAYSNEPHLLADYGVPMLVKEGYQVVHFSDGYYLYKRAVYQRETYFIFRRVPGNSSLDKPDAGTPTWEIARSGTQP